MQIKNIILDLGAVIIDIDYNLTAESFIKLGVSNFDEIYSKKKQDHFFDDFETGVLSDDDFRKEIKKHLRESVTDRQITNAWNAMLIGVPIERYKWLENLGRTFRIFLLSNTNRIHVKAFSEMIEKDYGIKKFESLFEKTYYSCMIGMRKPNKDIFELVMTENNLVFENTIFIDDSPQHVEGARNFGLTAWHLEDGMRVEELIRKMIPA